MINFRFHALIMSFGAVVVPLCVHLDQGLCVKVKQTWT